MILDALQEILAYTYRLGFIELVKVTGTEKVTEFNAISDNRNVMLNSEFKKPEDEFIGIVGLHDLRRLDTILNIPEYKENAIIKTTKMVVNDENVLTGISFTNEAGDFKNNYRFMTREIVEAQLPSLVRKPISWDISIQPSQMAIQRLKFQSQAAGSDIKTFNIRTDKDNLIFSLGDVSTHSGSFIFSSDIHGKLSESCWPLLEVEKILNLPGDKIMQLSNMGVMEIQITTGLAVHSYTIRASSMTRLNPGS
jgi:hypothetical protein